ncbi:AAA family ATPase [Streptomyces sp. NPDC089799]|uniref:AAA family ATPase n=1 Tax=Streptomyces sp. NPDC089799 TaxID=3155066 RepID=UPI003419A3F4
MPLTTTQWDLVREWARDHVFNVASSHQSQVVNLGFSQEFAASIPYGDTASSAATALVRAVRNRGVKAQFQLLAALCTVDSLAVLPIVGMARQFRDILEADAELDLSPRDPYQAGVLKNGAEVFIDRLDLRQRLREFADDPYKTVLVVDGAPDSGRSYTYNLIRHLGAHNGFQPVRVTLNQTSTADQVVHWLADYVTDPHTGISPLNPTQLNDPLPVVHKAVHRIVMQATAAEEQFWFVLDDCDRLDLNSDVWDCIGKLAEMVYEYGDRAGAPRLVLLGYSDGMRQLGDEIRNNEVRDTARVVTPDDLRDFFGRFFRETTPPGHGAPPEENAVAALVNAAVPAVLQAAEAPGPESFMRKVCAATVRVVRLYRSSGPGHGPGPGPGSGPGPGPGGPEPDTSPGSGPGIGPATGPAPVPATDHHATFISRLDLQISTPEPEPPPVSDLRLAYREAACLFTQFDPTRLRLAGEDEPTGRAMTELVDDCRGGGNMATASWTLKPEIREQTLRSLPGPAPARFALLANMDQLPPGPGIERTALAYLNGIPPDLPRQSADELPYTLQAVLWLSLIKGVAHIPEIPTVQRLLDRARLQHPLQRLVQDSFQGRATELATLRAYIGIPTDLPALLGPLPQGDGPTPPVVLHGPGGIGKSTLLAKFLLDSLHDFPSGFPFAYIDFERPTLSVHEPSTLIAEMARQLGIQYPDDREAFDALAHECEETATAHQAAQASVDALQQLATTRSTLGRSSSAGLHGQARKREAELAARLAALVVEAVGAPTGEPQPPLVIVIDSFEEAQYRGSPLLGRFWAIWSALEEAHPRLRVVVSGRKLAEHPARVVQPLALELGELDPAAAVTLLMSCGVTDKGLAGELAERVGGHPLSLKLAARAARTAAEQSDNGVGSLRDLIDSLPAQRRQFFRQVDQMLIQGTLYDRILDRIRDDRVRALAHAGLALRSITPELIREVLAEPCGLRVDSDDEARALFGLLSRLDLVEPAGPGAVRHRSDLRAIMLRLAERARMDLMRAVGAHAVAYYSAREGLEARAEEIYHRLRLNENPRDVEQRWLPGVEQFLEGAEEDMAGRSAAYLSGQLGDYTPDEVLKEADQEDWERIAAHEVADLLAQGYAHEAAARLAERRPWTAGSPLHPLWVDTLDRLGRRAEARTVAAETVDQAEEAGFPRLQLELLTLSAWLAEADGDLASAADDLADAERVATGLGDGLEALGARFARANLGFGAAAETGGSAGDQLAGRLHELSDADLTNQAALVREAAAEVAHAHPQLLERALEVVGLPQDDQQVVSALALAIDRAVAQEPGLRDELDALLKNAAPQVPPTTPGEMRTPRETPDSLREAQQLGTLNGLARRLLDLQDRSGELASGVAAAMSVGALAGLAPGGAWDADSVVGKTTATAGTPATGVSVGPLGTPEGRAAARRPERA